MPRKLLVAVAAVAGGGAMILGLSGAAARRSASGAAMAGSVTEGTLTRIDPKGDVAEPCPLKHTDVRAEISGFIARVNVTQEFLNPTAENIEAVYRFPLPPDSAVDAMTMLVGDRNIIGKIRRREEARQIYDTARSRGQLASLLDQERPNIFTQSVANIKPGQAVRITISYVETLKYEDASFEFRFPMVVGPRYVPRGLLDADRVTVKRTPEGTRAGHDVSVQVNLDAGLALASLESPTHVVDVARTGGGHAAVKLRDQATIPNKDFVLRYAVASQKIEDALLTHADKRGGYFMLVLDPPARVAPAEITPKEIVFVLDTSGSMMGFPIEKAKEAMKLAIDGLNPRDTFNLITFAGDEHILFPKPVPATTENVRQAEQFLMSRQGGGGTEMMKAIRAALDPSDQQDHIRIACFMTDGEVGNDFEIVNEVQRHPQARVFAFGIGGSVNHFLLDNMARYGRGEVEYVGLNDDGDAAAKRFHERVRTPVLTDVAIDWGGLPVTEVYPKRIPDLFSAKPVIVVGRYLGSAKGSIRLRGKVGGRAFDRTIAVTLPASEPSHDVAATLWARAKVGDLMGSDFLGLQNGQAKSEVRDAITQIGLDYALMTQFTSFVAVEETIVTEGGQLRRIEVPVEMPEGVSYEGIYGSERTVKISAAMPAMARPQTFSTGGVIGGVPSMAQVAPPAMTDRMAARPASSWKISPALRAVSAGTVFVQIYLTDTTETTLKRLKDLGVEIAALPQSGRIVIARVDASKLAGIAKLTEVRFIAPQK